MGENFSPREFILFGEIMKPLIIATALGITLLLAPSAMAADWEPTFVPGQAVYIDPALVNSENAPVKFGAELEQKIKEVGAKADVNYYVWAIEATNAPTNKPLF